MTLTKKELIAALEPLEDNDAIYSIINGGNVTNAEIFVWAIGQIKFAVIQVDTSKIVDFEHEFDNRLGQPKT